ncbi:hypothetical protein [Streptomyces sp. NPDC060205]|uniref:hypothetical protein n=1 Tax=Streptomyces sp. NPDC060205 TaxID=3347072 RepID=UPI003667B472
MGASAGFSAGCAHFGRGGYEVGGAADCDRPFCWVPHAVMMTATAVTDRLRSLGTEMGLVMGMGMEEV